MSTTQQSIDATIAAAAGKTTQLGASTTVVGWALSSEMGILSGIVIGVAGLVVQLVFKIREDRRREAEHQRRMRDMEERKRDGE